MEIEGKMGKYVRSIRNVEKKRYATDYATYLLNGGRKNGAIEPDGRTYKLGYMARQAVEMELVAIRNA